MTTLLVIPCFCESKRLPRFLPDLCEHMRTLGDVEILVVDDGSGPDEVQATRVLVDQLRQTHSLLHPLLALPDNIGKGGTIYAGWSNASPSVTSLAFVDADGSISPSEVTRLITLSRQISAPVFNTPTFDVPRSPTPHSPLSTLHFFGAAASPAALFGSRIKMLGRSVDRQFKRHLLGRIYATLVSESLDIPVYDSQCGLKIVPRAAYESIAHRLTIKGFAFDVDLLVHLLDHGTPVVEVPIDWHEEPGGSVHLLRDSWRMARDVLRIRRNRRPL